MPTLPTWRQLNADTSPDLEAFQFARLRALGPANKMALFSSLNQAAYRLAFLSLRRRHPDENEMQLRFRMTELMYGRERARRLYGEVAPPR